MQKNRPVNLNLLTISFPVTAIVSILHRISGVLLFLGFPFVLYIFSQSVASAETFAALPDLLQCGWMRAILAGFFIAAGYHFLAGIRHIIMDFGWFESLPAARISAKILMVLLLAGIILGGWWLC